MQRTESQNSRAVAQAQAAEPQTQNLLIIMIGIMLGILLAALDQTVVGPAMPQIIGDLSGFDRYVWPFTAYMLTSTIVVPVSGKLGDMYGRKWFYIGGIVVFLIGSMLSGLSTTMDQLILFRAVQGLGGGIMFANAFAIIGDLVPAADRGRWQGLFGAVWGLSSVFGPSVGGFLTDNLDWRWVFYVNLPFGLLALAVLFFTLPNLRREQTRKPSIDWLGTILLTAGLTPLLVALSLTSTEGWTTNTYTLIGIGVVLLVGFVFAETRAKEPILPLDLFKNSIFTLSVITVFLTGLGMFGAVSFVPLFIQAVQSGSATESGQALTPMMLAVVFSSIVSGQILSRTGKYRLLGIGGMTFLTFGMFLLSTMNVSTERWTTILFMVVMGLGLGVAMPLYNLVVQNAFPMNQMGVVTAAVTFFRSIGGTIGVAVLGAFVNNRFQQDFLANLQQIDPRVAAQMPPEFVSQLNPQALVSPEAIEGIRTAIMAQGVPEAAVGTIVTEFLEAMKPALASATTASFFIGAVALVIAIVATAFIREIPLRTSNAPGAAAMAEGGFIEEPAEEVAQVTEKAGKELVAAGMPGASNIPAKDEPRLA